MKEKRQAKDLRMSSAAFDGIMRGVFQVAPPSPKKGRATRRKTGGKKARF